MKHTYATRELEQIQFATNAANFFAKDGKHRTFGEVKPGSFFAQGSAGIQPLRSLGHEGRDYFTIGRRGGANA